MRGSLTSDLSEGSLGSEQFVEQTDGDTEHRRQSQAPADHLPPPRVHVHVVVGQRLVVHQVEQKDALRRTEQQENSLKLRRCRAPSSLSVLPHTHYADARRNEGPAPLHPGERSIANHTSDIVHEAVSTCRQSTGTRCRQRLQAQRLHFTVKLADLVCETLHFLCFYDQLC